MKKLTETQKEIEVLAGRVPMLTERQKEWGRRNFNYFICLPQGKTEFRCKDCKKMVKIDQAREVKTKWCHTDRTFVCPHCGARHQVREVAGGGRSSYSTKPHQEEFFQVMSVVGEWQVTRLIYMHRYCYVHKDNTPWEYWEVCQAWNNPKQTKTHFRAFPKTMQMHNPFNPYKLWNWGSEWDAEQRCYIYTGATPCTLEPRHVGSGNYFDTTAIAPDAKILKAYRKMGITTAFLRQSERNVMWLLESMSGRYYKPMYETLLKCKDYRMYDRVTSHKDDADSYFTAWKICRRNGYVLKGDDYTEWFDLVRMLGARHLDIHNPHYVCPVNLHEMHNHFVEMEERDHEREMERQRRERDALARERARVAMLTREEKNDEFVLRRRKYFGIGIATDKFKIVCLKSIDDFEKEGKLMKHCVFTGGYYLRENSLILSARDAKDKPIETLEVDLRSFRILQCYGKHDEFTELHSEIVDTMNRNMSLIRDIKDGRVKLVAS